ncbi:glycosyltransferase family 2 protein [Antarctobacter heliothermus]|uniref:Glycosyl transferase family 2 n=1 Tax=Antarctobacter heliothermus TaxID=74033 RepID=A0A239HJA7_9RHOB|nr:glycosyltransferase family 2 protein [Antarctobacter heliothermus]SNS81225.1 Glycosyl transferase family 2 [Antarctobacter heliothermus]
MSDAQDKTSYARRIALAACMRNEGIFVLEWLAHHRALGFDPVIVVTNDITDGSDTLLDALAAKGLVTHIAQTVPAGAAPQDSGMDRVLRHARDRGISHILHIDSDEFLALLDGSLADLMTRTEQADVVAVPWRAFGDSGVTHWSPGDLVTERNTHAEAAPVPRETKTKCLFRVASFARATDHNPLDPQVDDPVVMTPDAELLDNRTLYNAKSARFRPHYIAARPKTAQLFHYAIRAQDCFLMKNDRGDGQGRQGEAKYHLNSAWHRKANRNEVEERALADCAPALRKTLAEWRADPAIAKAEKACQDWFIARRAQLLTPENRAAWTRGKVSI